MAQRVLTWPTELASEVSILTAAKYECQKTQVFAGDYAQAFCVMMDSMETKKPDVNSRFAEVTKRAQEERAKKPKQKREDPHQPMSRNFEPRDNSNQKG